MGDTPRKRTTLHKVLNDRRVGAAVTISYDAERGRPQSTTRALTEKQIIDMNNAGLKALGSALANTTFGGPRAG